MVVLVHDVQTNICMSAVNAQELFIRKGILFVMFGAYELGIFYLKSAGGTS